MLPNYLATALAYAIVAGGAVVGLCVLLSLRIEVRKLRSRLVNQNVNAQLEEMRTRLEEAEKHAGMLVAPPTLRSGLNLNKRSQVIRMSRRGERVDNIAASLKLPRRHVDLLLKIHGMVLKSSAEPASQASS